MGKGAGAAEQGEEEGVMATDFFWSYTDEPHASRRRKILSQYPQIKELFGPDPWAFLKITAAVLLQLWTAAFLHDAGWLKIFSVAYFFGSFLNHNLFLAIHELSHNLAFSTPSYNRWLASSPTSPSHHRFQGVDGIDMDIPTRTEGRLVANPIAKSIWVLFQLFFYTWLRWSSSDGGRWATSCCRPLWAGGCIPWGHFISEHYVFKPEQETYSYYGPLNLMTWSVGFHNEHHDFPRIPGTASTG
ncbi:unnamed protein product [Spirodela intermedia]|uniref:Sphingolipid delta4-desaturase N-terminal domain-containing protein n=1 Tax=Spirodela intermedia TaxID=51605 RepID=A0A7I8IEZ0_SPIIN|nr:unnamed protein product [Spirodela intermedia]CAA6655663.1 unnamed protein product [Spirodela intermedia]